MKEKLMQGAQSLLLKNIKLFPEEYEAAAKELDAFYQDETKLPSKIGLKGEKNSRYDSYRLDYINRALDFLLKYYAPEKPPITAILTENEQLYADAVKLLNSRRLIEHIAFTIFHLSGSLRAKYKHLLIPAPFTWETFEQLGGLMKLAPPTYSATLVTNVTGEAAERFNDEYLNVELIVEAAVPTILQEDIHKLKQLFIHIEKCEKQPNLQQQALEPVGLMAIKTLTRRIIDLENLIILLKYADNHCTELNHQSIISEIKKKGKEGQLYSVEVEKTDNRFERQYKLDTKLGQHAALRRLEKIGELITGKNFSSFLKELDPTIDWQALVAMRDAIAHQDEKDNKAKIDTLLNDEALFKTILQDEMSEFFNALTMIIGTRDKSLPKFNKEEIEKFWIEVFSHEKKIQSDLSENNKKGQIEQVQVRATKEDADLFIQSLNNAKAPSDIQEKWRSIFNGTQSVPDKKEYGNLLTYLPSRKDNNELYKNLKRIADKAINQRSDLASREQVRLQQQTLTKQREEEQEKKFIGLTNLRKFAKSLDENSFKGHGLTHKQRIEAAIEALVNIKEFMEKDDIIQANFNFSSIKEWETYQTKETALKLFDKLENPEFNDAIEYNAAQFLQHLDTIRKFPEARGYHYLDRHYDDLKYLRNYIEHGNHLFDKEEYEPDKEPPILSFRQQKACSIMITLIFKLLPSLKNLSKTINTDKRLSDDTDYNQDDIGLKKTTTPANTAEAQLDFSQYEMCLEDYQYYLKSQNEIKTKLKLQLTDYQILERFKNISESDDKEKYELYNITMKLMLVYQRLLSYQYILVDQDNNKATTKREFFTIINNQKFIFEEYPTSGDGWCTFNAAGIENPVQALLELKNKLNDGSVANYLAQAIMNNVHAVSLGEEFAITSNDSDGNSISEIIMSLFNKLQQLPIGGVEHVSILTQLAQYLSRQEVQSAYIDYLIKTKYVDENVVAACLSLKGKRLAAFHNYLGNGQLTSNVADDIEITDTNVVHIVFHPGSRQSTAHYNVLKLTKVFPIHNDQRQSSLTKSKKSLKEQIFNLFKLDPNKDEKLELERGLRIVAANNYVAQLSYFFKPELRIQINIDAAGPTTGKTALHIALEKKNKEIVSELLSRGAKFDIPDNEGRTALQLADGDSEIEALFSVAKESLNKICDIGSLRSPS
jgi:uncharacterized protein with HEPN domain